MSFLPNNERKVPIETPKVFVIFGESMHGKSYLADEFPNPVIFNTDDNARSVETPSIAIYNGMTHKGEKLSAFEYLAGAVDELANTDKHGFETVIVDTTEDLFFMIQEALADSHDREFFSDIPHGVGWMKYKSLYTKFVLALKKLTLMKGMYVVYIVRAIDKTENNVTTKIPNIGDKELNVINGNSDYRILCQKIGKNYIRRAVLKRKNYEREKIGDERILKILDTVNGAFERTKRVTKEQQDQIVETIEQNEDVLNTEKDEVSEVKAGTQKVVKQDEQRTQKAQAPEPKKAPNKESEPKLENDTNAVEVEEPKQDAPIKPPRQAPKQTEAPIETPTTRTARPARRPRPVR